MQRQDFHYHLPEELIAKMPPEKRGDSRLLCLSGNTGEVEDVAFGDILDRVSPGDLMVFNDTRVIPARVFGEKRTGGKLEILVERVLSTDTVLAHMRSSKSPKAGAEVILEGGTVLQVVRREGALFVLQFPEGESALDVLERIGHMPLPPYIDRADAEADRERYQTVYGRKQGAVAAPTAGLHFDDTLLEKLKAKGVNIAFVTLHVGAGTFQPVRVDDIHEHVMHSEWMDLTEDVVEQVKATQLAGNRVIAVGTTSVRCLETASRSGEIAAYQGDTDIFIYPGYRYQVVDALVTNFHLPESTLMMLVSAFAGYRHIMDAYQHAIEQRYRFFSYGDAMFILKNTQEKVDLPPSSNASA